MKPKAYSLKDKVEIKEVDGAVKTYTEITVVRRLKAKDLRGINFNAFESGSLDMGDLLHLVEKIVKEPLHVLEELTIDDVEGLMDFCEPFFGGSSPKPKSKKRK